MSTSTQTTATTTTAVSTTAGQEVGTSATTAVTTTTTKETVSATTTTAQKVTEGEKPTTTQTPTTTKAKVVGVADPETGISWDGKSPIVYTYQDGSTGTTPKDGALYEYEPGIMRGYVAPTAVYDGKCSRCGKKEGNGLNGTCLSYWTGGDHNCPHCGMVVPEDTCHTCKE